MERKSLQNSWRAGPILLAGVVAYSNSLSHPFIDDNLVAIVDNTSIRDLDLATVLSPAQEGPTAGRPPVNLSFAVNYALGGLRASTAARSQRCPGASRLDVVLAWLKGKR